MATKEAIEGKETAVLETLLQREDAMTASSSSKNLTPGRIDIQRCTDVNLADVSEFKNAKINAVEFLQSSYGTTAKEEALLLCASSDHFLRVYRVQADASSRVMSTLPSAVSTRQ